MSEYREKTLKVTPGELLTLRSVVRLALDQQWLGAVPTIIQKAERIYRDLTHAASEGEWTVPTVRLRKLAAARSAFRARLALLETDEPIPPQGWHRAGGDAVCSACNLAYYDHPSHPRLSWLTILCDGSLVKL